MAYSFKRIVEPLVEPITIEQARLWCRRGTELDALLPIWIASARWEAEHQLQRSLISQTWEMKLDEWPTGDNGPDVQLWWAPQVAITGVQYIDPNGATQTLASNQYVLDNRTLPGWLTPAINTSWPATQDVLSAITITFTAGYGASGASVPAPILRWMGALIVAIAENPGMLDPSGKVIAMPSRFVDRALDGFIIPSC